MDVNVPRIGRKNRLIRPQDSVDDRRVGLRAASQQENIGLRHLAQRAYLLFGTLRIDIKSVGGGALVVGLHQTTQHQRMRTIIVIAIK